ncbi:MAG: phosphoglycerate mutase, partial [Mycobacterium sp.]
DGFQRVCADPASMSVIRYTRLRPFVLHVNHTGARLTSALTAAVAPDGETPPDDAVVGGSTD